MIFRDLRTPLLAIGVLGGLLALPATAQETWEDDAPDPRALARAAAEYVAGLPAFSFSWFISYDEVIEGREKLTFMRSGSNIMQRGTGFYSYAELGAKRRAFFHDGTSFTISAPDDDYYATAPYDGSFEDLVEAAREQTGTVVPVWSMMSADLPSRLSSDDEDVLAYYVEQTLIAGRSAHHLSFASDDEDWQLWVSTDEAMPVPLMLVGTNLREQGWPQYRVFFYDWETEPEIAEGAFTFVPDEDDIPVAMPALIGATAGAAPAEDSGAESGAESGEAQ